MKKRRFLHIVPFLVFTGLLVSLWYHTFWGPNRFSERREISITVSRGDTFRDISDSLVTAGVVENRVLFQMAGRIKGWTTQMKVGRYVFQDGISNHEILSSLRSGRSTIAISVTIPEGYRATQIAKLLSRRIGIDSSLFVRLLHDPALLTEFGIKESTLEGYLLPDTYLFYWQMDEHEIIRVLVGQFRKFFTDSLAERALQLGLTTREILTVAAIVEGEAIFDSERPTIAGVFYNRLKKGMKLEADPTIQYLLSDGPRRILYSDLVIDSPYNTYLYPGLPPTPINNPGRKSILAALYPENHNYLYFVSDRAGGHIFSRTYEEHQKAVQQYRRLRDLASANDTTSQK